MILQCHATKHILQTGLRKAKFLPVLLGDHRRQSGHGRAALALLLVYDLCQDARGGAGTEMGDLLSAQDQDPAIVSRSNG